MTNFYSKLFYLFLIVFVSIGFSTINTCIDGTESGMCSVSKPKECVNGYLIDNALKCGCPPEFNALGKSCIKNPNCRRIVNLCNVSNKTTSYNVTYIFDRGYRIVISENHSYPEETCQSFDITFDGENCDIEKERQAIGVPLISPTSATITEKIVDCGWCPSICERNPPNETTCGACVCPSNSGYCDQIGIRDTKNGRPVYCYNELWQTQKENQGTCQNNFECKSNFCSEGTCYNLVKEVSQNKDLLQQILDFLKGIFGG